MSHTVSDDAHNFQEKHKVEPIRVPFSIYTAADDLNYSQGNSIATFFIWAFLGFIFFIGAASVLYFRMYNDLTNENKNILRLQSSA